MNTTNGTLMDIITEQLSEMIELPEIEIPKLEFEISSHSQAYLEFSTCAAKIGAKALSRTGKLSAKAEECLALQEDACRLCVCCEYCPCEASQYYFGYVIALVAAGILFLALATSILQRCFPRWSGAAAAAAAASIAPMMVTSESTKFTPWTVDSQGKDGSTTDAPALKSPLKSLSRRERTIVRRAIDLWDRDGVLPWAYVEELRASTKFPEDQDAAFIAALGSGGGVLSVLFIASAFAIALLESTASETALYKFGFEPLLKIVGQENLSLAKAVAMLTLAALAHFRAGGLPWELMRALFVMAYIGCIAFSVVDTGRHVGETASSTLGSDLWYVSVGAIGSLAMLCLSRILPLHYKFSYVWVACAMAMMVTPSQVNSEYRVWLYGLSLLCLVVGGIGKTKPMKEYVGVGTLYLVLAAMMSEVDDEGVGLPFVDDWMEERSRGTWLALVSVLVLGYGALVASDSNQAAVAAMGGCGGVVLLNEGWALYDLNAFLRLAVVFTFYTVWFGGWGLPAVIPLPVKSRQGVSIVLVVATTMLLLVTIVVGNSHHGNEWTKFMDFGERAWYEWDFVDGDFVYTNRGVRMLPWIAPFTAYYFLLCRLWPDMERRIHSLHAIRVAAFLICACHLMRLVSWSMLFLWLAAVWLALPKIEGIFRGNV